MKTSSILFGSMATVAFSTAIQAADAIVAEEPEPVTYVRVCDAFGKGYFYIPGTETCLRIDGYLRMRVLADSQADKLNYSSGAFSFSTSGGDSYATKVRARVNFRTKTQTELGDLNSYIRFQANNSGTPSSDATIKLDQGYLQLAGLLSGYTESAWVYSTNGGKSGFGAHGAYGGEYGYQQRNLLQYQFNGSNWFAAVSLEDDGVSTSWTPDIVGRVGGVIGGTTVFGVLAYDQDNGTTDTVWQALGGPAGGSGVDEIGAKLGLNANVGSAGNLRVQGFYASGTTAFGANLDVFDQTFTPQWSVLASYSHAISPNVTFNGSGQYFGNFYNAANATTGVDGWRVSGELEWEPVDNFTIAGAAEYIAVDDPDRLVAASGLTGGDASVWQFLLQLRRTF